ncbi:MAG TPA: hypothetical protein VGD03_11995 [Frankiaceae bacterium]
MSDARDGQASAAAREAGAVEEVERNTKSQTTAATYTTTDHDVIRAWTEKRGGRPAAVARTESGDDPGILRIEFPNAPGGEARELQPLDWETFFKKFDENNLSFVYQEKTADGAESRFFKFVKRDKG